MDFGEHLDVSFLRAESETRGPPGISLFVPGFEDVQLQLFRASDSLGALPVALSSVVLNV